MKILFTVLLICYALIGVTTYYDFFMSKRGKSIFAEQNLIESIIYGLVCVVVAPIMWVVVTIKIFLRG